MAQIGEVPLPVGGAQQPLADAGPPGLGGLEACHHPGHPGGGEILRRGPQLPGDRCGDLLPISGQSGGVEAKEPGHGSGPHVHRPRLLQRRQQHRPVGGRLRYKYRGAGVDHGGHAALGERGADQFRLLVLPHDDRVVAGPHRSPGAVLVPDLSTGGQVGDQFVGDVRHDTLLGLGLIARTVAQAADPYPPVIAARRVLDPAFGLVRGDPADHDLVADFLAAEVAALHQLHERRHHCVVAAVVDTERLHLGAGAGCGVAVDVGAAEGVDALLRVADEDHPAAGPVGEGGCHDRPLAGVGVLELVDEHHFEPGCQVAPRAVIIADGPSQAQHGVVEGDQSQVVLPLREDRANLLGDLQALNVLGFGGYAEPGQLRVRVGQDRFGDGARVRRVRPLIVRRGVSIGVAGDVHIAHDLLDEVAHLLGDHLTGIGVGSDAEPRECVDAGLVDGADAGGVEA